MYSGTVDNIVIIDFFQQKSGQAAKTISSYAKNVFYKIADKQKQLSLELDNKLSNLLMDQDFKEFGFFYDFFTGF